ncbi:hypothetical protein [Sphingomonas sp.]|jgi:putative endonuclease|uniref:hypothetical protein n=1 Tax=Sphingomonas sp. TaxID=28214 RepID=UPI0035C866D0
MAGQRKGTLCRGGTSDRIRRAYRPRTGAIDGFSKEHGGTLLVWFERYDDIQGACARELRLKKWKRSWKIDLIERANRSGGSVRDAGLTRVPATQEPRTTNGAAPNPGFLQSQEHDGAEEWQTSTTMTFS